MNMGFFEWLRRWLTLTPHQVIYGYQESDGVEVPYLLRWYVLPRNRWFNVYVHCFLRDDDDRALHDHPWDSVSFLVKGKYKEYTPCDLVSTEASQKVTAMGGRIVAANWVETYKAPAMIKRSAEHKHRIALIDGRPAWTVFITGPKRRGWGFWCPQGFVPWREFTDPLDSGKIGRGCE